MEVGYVIAFSLGVVNVVKKHLNPQLVPVATVLLSMAVGVAYAYLYGVDVREFVNNVFQASLITTGLFVTGDAVRHGIFAER
jgi:biotin transporter BioY